MAEVMSGRILNLRTGGYVLIPSVDEVDVGFSCKSWSLLNQNKDNYAFAIAFGAGSAGETAAYALRFVEGSAPHILILENLLGLFRFYKRRFPITQQLEYNFTSNNYILLSRLKGMGYIAPACESDSTQRCGVRRPRAYLPCVLCDGAVPVHVRDELAEAAVRLMELLIVANSRVIALEEIIMDEDDEDFDLWHHKQLFELKASSVIDSRDIVKRWHGRHRRTFKASGLTYPPVFAAEFQECVSAAGMIPREAEIVHYEEISSPIVVVLLPDVVCDVSQNLGRHPVSGGDGILPTILPGGRYWLRRQRRWLYGAEALRAQGFGATIPSRNYKARQIFDLSGNSFQAGSLLSAKACAYALAGKLL